MGWRYVSFRGLYELKRKTGIMKMKYPVRQKLKNFISLEAWRKQNIPFFFQSKSDLKFEPVQDETLQLFFQNYKQGKFKLFNAAYFELGKNFDWLTNPDSGYRYDIKKHWVDVEDFSVDAGDIKFVWEKSRFAFLFDLIRYDFHFKTDCSQLVFDEIESWLNANPVNCGPNFKCSQEISLRILNWTFALYYYKNSQNLTEPLFQKIINAVYWQLKHVFENINFSRIAVRNNHAVTETLMIFLGGVLFPFFKEAQCWRKRGKDWFEEEIAYQIYKDGTFLQFSHNYHRVLIQLLTWAFYLAAYNGISFSRLTYDRAARSLNYLFQCLDLNSGWLPNYGANDGALFFKLNNQPYRDYRPQLNALFYFFNHKNLLDNPACQEDVKWLTANCKHSVEKRPVVLKQQALNTFPEGGIFTIRDESSFTFIKCASYKDRPSHADNLHVDIWYEGKNILRDAGTFKYNTTPELSAYFTGTAGHNTVVVAGENQMKKGPRFIWLDWSACLYTKLEAEKDYWYFEGKIHAFKHLGNNIFHTRKLKKFKKEACWEIEDILENTNGLPITQIWNPGNDFEKQFEITAIDTNGNTIQKEYQPAFFSGLYGVKESLESITFTTNQNSIFTRIQAK